MPGKGNGRNTVDGWSERQKGMRCVELGKEVPLQGPFLRLVKFFRILEKTIDKLGSSGYNNPCWLTREQQMRVCWNW